LFQESSKSASTALFIAASIDKKGDHGTNRTARNKADGETNDGESQRHVGVWFFLLGCFFFGAVGGVCGSIITLALMANRKKQKQ
jgi:hypothetical protein